MYDLKIFDENGKPLQLEEVMALLQINYLPNCNRVEVIEETGRVYVNHKPNNKVHFMLQDDGRTLKIGIRNKE